jgi:tyrosinase
MTEGHFTRRELMTGAGAVILATQLSPTPAQAAAKYTRYSVTSPEGQKMLASYAKGVDAMLKLPADDPRNWFRNAFIHLMDCPHGNWWFYVWHRGYLGYFEQTIRSLSGDASFALPFWDWTELPEIPAQMFDGPLTPTDAAFAPYTGNLALFTSFIQPTLAKYFGTLSPAQQAQQNSRGYTAFDKLWNDVTGFNPNILPPGGAGISGNMAYAITCGARYLSRGNSKFDAATAYDVSEFVVYSGLLPTDFNNPVGTLSFTSSKTASHNSPAGTFSTLEGMPHNQVHNYIGGVGALDPGPYGNMTNFLSPVDPIFFLHHANMDRLWDVWTRKQKALNLPWLPPQPDLKTLSDEPFLFFVNDKGNYITDGKAGDYLSTDVFEYDYAPGFGEKVISTPAQAALRKAPPVKGAARGNTASLALPNAALEAHLNDAAPRPLMAQVTLPHPGPASSGRSFDVLVNAPGNVTEGADSPFYAGTIAFFGAMTAHAQMRHDATFVVPLPKKPQVLRAPAPTAAAKKGPANTTPLTIRLVPSRGQAGPAPTIKSVTVGPA